MALPAGLDAVRIICHDYLEPGTILVSPDIWKIIRETYAEEGRDRAFLRDVGILPDEHPPRETKTGESE